MTNLHDLPFKSLQFYATAPYACSYLADLDARSQVVTPPQLITTKVYSELIQSGFRRSGHYTYRPYCDHCKACIASRIVVAQFKPTRSQRRAFKKHQALTAKVLSLTFSKEHFDLYQRYIRSRHSLPIGPDTPSNLEEDEDQYRQFLIQSHITSFLVEFREHGVLKMVSVIDQVQDGLSSVYTFFDPDSENSSFGIYGILWQVAYAQQENLPYVYLGYYIQKSQKMAYKIQFQPLEGLVDGHWTLIHP